MRRFLRDSYVRRFIGGFTFGLIAFAAVQSYQASAEPAPTPAPVSASVEMAQL